MSQQLPPDGGQPWNPQQPPPNYSQPLYGQPQHPGPPSHPGYPPQQPLYSQQPPTFYPPQQPGYPQPGQMQRPPFTPPPSKRTRIAKWARRHPIWTVIIVFLGLSVVIGPFTGHSDTTTSSTVKVAPTAAATIAPTSTPVPTVKPTPTPKPKPTPTPAPTASPAQIEQKYKAGTTDSDVATLDKNGSAGMGDIVHFTATITSFVKDDSGNTAGVNVTDAASSAFVQVLFTPGTDIAQMNVQDTLEVWGPDLGSSSGTNAFGGTVQEVVIQAQYLTDQTTGYTANS